MLDVCVLSELESFQLLCLQICSLPLSLSSLWDPYNTNISTHDVVWEVSLTVFISFYHFSFFIQLQWFPTMFSSLLIQCSISFNLLLIPSSTFSFQLLYSCCLFGWSLHFLTLVKTSNFLLYGSILHQSSLNMSYNHYLEFSIVHHQSPLDLVVILEFHLHLEDYFSVTSFRLTCSFYFCVSGRLVTFPDLGEVAFCRRHSVSQQHIQLGSPELYAPGVSSLWTMWVLLWWADYYG